MRKYHFFSFMIVLITIASLLAGCAEPTTTPEAVKTEDVSASVPDVEEEQTEEVEDAAPVEPIVLGTLQDVSGKGSVLGNASMRGAELAVEMINAQGGIDGVPIKLVVGDHKSDPQEAIKEYERLVDLEGAVTVLGPPVSGIGLAIIESTNTKKVPVLGMFGDPRVMVNEDGSVNQYMFLMQPSSKQSAEIIADYTLTVLGLTKFATLTAVDHAYVTTMTKYFEEFVTANGGEIVLHEEALQDDKDFKAQLTKIKNSDAEMVFNSMPTQPLVISVDQAYELGMTTPMCGSLDFAFPFTTLVKVKEGVSEIYFGNNIKEDDDAIKVIRDAYFEKYGEEPTNKSYLGYDEVLIFVEAVKQAGSTDPAALRDAFENKIVELPITTGVITISPEDHMPRGLSMVIYKIENGEYVYQGRHVPEAHK